jgi:hypothetical protein
MLAGKRELMDGSEKVRVYFSIANVNDAACHPEILLFHLFCCRDKIKIS